MITFAKKQKYLPYQYFTVNVVKSIYKTENFDIVNYIVEDPGLLCTNAKTQAAFKKK